ncbi:MAG TPA: methyltransferase [Vicinamibacterales bacterium]|nr:methyltransferase [Vicinamibacterales bacterium]
MYGFRRARPAESSRNVAKTAIQIVFFWGTFLVMLPAIVAAFERDAGVPQFPTSAGRVVAALAFIGASVLGLASAFTMATTGKGTPLPYDAPRRLVTTGPYAWIRNPMAAAGMGQGAAVALWYGSIAVLAYVIAGGVIWHVAVRPLEEQDLVQVFGEPYIRYQSRVPLWWPRRPRA